MQMLGGQHRHVTAVIKSLPLREDGGNPAAPLPQAERQLAETLRQQCLSLMEGAVHPQHWHSNQFWGFQMMDSLLFSTLCACVLLSSEELELIAYMTVWLQAGRRLLMKTLRCLLMVDKETLDSKWS